MAGWPWGCNQQNPECKILYRANNLVSTTIKFKGEKKKQPVWTYILKETYQHIAMFGTFKDPDFFFKVRNEKIWTPTRYFILRNFTNNFSMIMVLGYFCVKIDVLFNNIYKIFTNKNMNNMIRSLLQNNSMGGKENEWNQDEIKLATRWLSS